MEVSVRHQKHHYDVISYHWVSKLAYFVEDDIGYQPSKFQCSKVSGSSFTEGGGKHPPPSATTTVLIGLNKKHFKLQSEVQVEVPPVLEWTHPTEFSEI